MAFRSLSENIILVDLVDIEVTRRTLLKLAATGGHQVRFKVSTVPLFICFAVWEDAVLDSDVRAILHEMMVAFAQSISHVAHVAIYHD